MKLQEIYTKNNKDYTITKIDDSPNAVWISMTDSEGITTTYGRKVFKAKFTKKETNV